MPFNLDQSGRKENFTRGERERERSKDRHDLFKIGKGTQSEAIEMKKIVAMVFTIV